jgi:tetratricopeptide (TPR) repeat protein
MGTLLDYYGPMFSFKRLATLAGVLTLSCSCALADTAPPRARSPAVLEAELVYQILTSEISVQNGDVSSGYTLMLDAARKADDPKLYTRAVEIALAARSGESALSAATAWVKAFPTSSEANRYVLQILVGLNKTSETQDPIQRWLAALPVSERATAISSLQRFFNRSADKKLAARVVEKALNADLANPTTGPVAWAVIGQLRLNDDDKHGALDAMRRGATLDPQSQEVVLLALRLLDADTNAAEETVRRYLAGSPSPEIQMAYARRLLEERRYTEGYQRIQQLTKDRPDFADGWLVQGSLEFQDKKWDTAKSSLLRYLEVQASSGSTSTAPASERGQVQAYLLLSQIAEQGRRWDEAQDYLEKIDATQDAMRVLVRRAGILARQGKLEEGRALLRSSPERQPEDARAKLSAEAQLLRDFKQFEALFALLQEAVERAPEDAELIYDQAMAAERLGKLPEMEALLRRVIAIKPDYHHAYNALGYSLAERGLRLVEARQLIAKALELAPNDPYIEDSLGWVEFRSGNLEEALRLLTGAHKARPDAEIAAHLGEVLWALNRRSEAQATWKSALELSPENETLLETMQRFKVH